MLRGGPEATPWGIEPFSLVSTNQTWDFYASTNLALPNNGWTWITNFVTSSNAVGGVYFDRAWPAMFFKSVLSTNAP